MAKWSKWVLDRLGWKITGWDPLQLKKYVVIVMPHTSNLDLPIGLLVRHYLQWDIKFLAKDSIFRWPFGGILRWLGGYPVDRSTNNNFVDSVADIFAEQETFRICITPEGTRSKVSKLKSGFYHIAREAGVPIVLVAFDYENKEVRIAPPVDSSLEYDEVFQTMKDFFRHVKGKNPELGFDFPD